MTEDKTKPCQTCGESITREGSHHCKCQNCGDKINGRFYDVPYTMGFSESITMRVGNCCRELLENHWGI